MSGDVEVHGGSALAITDGQDRFTEQQVATLRQLGLQDASDGDLMVFFHHVTRTGLDPFARQVYMISRNVQNPRTNQWETKWTIQTSIDGFRLVGRRAADRGRESLGMSDTEWCGADGVWHDVWLADEPPRAARVRIMRNGQPFPGVALFREYAQWTRGNNPRLTKMWAEKPALMIAKCAEALAWRKAFPQDLAGLYTADEMAAAEPPTAGHHDSQHDDVASGPVLDQQPQRRELPTDTPAEVHRERAKAHAAEKYPPRNAQEVVSQAGRDAQADAEPDPEPPSLEERLAKAQAAQNWRNGNRHGPVINVAKARCMDAVHYARPSLSWDEALSVIKDSLRANFEPDITVDTAEPWHYDTLAGLFEAEELDNIREAHSND